MPARVAPGEAVNGPRFCAAADSVFGQDQTDCLSIESTVGDDRSWRAVCFKLCTDRTAQVLPVVTRFIGLCACENRIIANTANKTRGDRSPNNILHRSLIASERFLVAQTAADLGCRDRGQVTELFQRIDESRVAMNSVLGRRL